MDRHQADAANRAGGFDAAGRKLIFLQDPADARPAEPGPAPAQPTLAAVVLTHGEHETYRSIVADLLDQGVAAERICVVHNPVRSEDRRVQAPVGVQVLRMPSNLGYAVAMNAGMRHHLERGAEWIWLLTHDVRLRPGATRAMLTAAQDGRYGALGPRLMQTGTDLVFSLGGARTRFGWPFNAGYGRRVTEVPPSRATTERSAWVDGSSIMLRAEALTEVGLYDTSMFGYAEDAVLCLRLERAGWPTAVVHEAVAEQTPGQISRPGPVSFLIARNCLRYGREAAGRLAIAAALLRYLRETIHYLRVAISGPRRRVAVIQCYATWAGVLAYFAGRTGPPPARMPGSGELKKR